MKGSPPIARLDQRVGAEIFDRDDSRRTPSPAMRTDSGRTPTAAAVEVRPGRRLERAAPPAPRRGGRDDVHRRRADEARGEDGGGPLVELGRRAVLLDAAVAHQHDVVGHGHGLDLVVGDVEHGDAEAALQRADLAPHLDAQLRVEIGERLVHQADRRLGDDRAAERDALLLAARELRGLALEQRLEAENAPRRAAAARRAPPRHLPHLEPEDDVLGDREVRETAHSVWNTIDTPRFAGGRLRRRRGRRSGSSPRCAVSSPAISRSVVDLPQPDGPEQRDELSRGCAKAHVVDGEGRAPAFRHLLQSDLRHKCRNALLPNDADNQP